jgi:hypothetical protein
MPKQYYTIRDWSGGINNKKDPRDIAENEMAYIQDMSIDALGKLKTNGGMYAIGYKQGGSGTLSEYIVERTAALVGGGGYGLAYFESDHSRDNEQTITETRSGVALALGTTQANGNIAFVVADTHPDAGVGEGPAPE